MVYKIDPREKIPKEKMMMPAVRLTQVNKAGVSFVRRRLTPVLSVNHQAAEPRKTPTTIMLADK